MNKKIKFYINTIKNYTNKTRVIRDISKDTRHRIIHKQSALFSDKLSLFFDN